MRTVTLSLPDLVRSLWSSVLSAPLWLVSACLLLIAHPAAAQSTNGITSVYPAGGQQGKSVEITLQGDAVTQAATGLWFNHPGIKAQKLEGLKFRVEVAANVPVGLYDVRATGPKGATNARTFAVDDLPEVAEKEPNSTPSQATPVASLPCIVNGSIQPAEDIDYYTFHAVAGQRLIVDFWGMRIDATPAQAFIFDGTLQLSTASGKPVAFSTDFNGVDPFLDVQVPETGDYVLKVWDFTYRGSDVCVYRIRIGQVPYLDYVFPAGGRRGTKVSVTYGGRNLPGGKPSGAAIKGRPLDALAASVDLSPDLQRPEGPISIRHWGRAADAFTEQISLNVSAGAAGTSDSKPFMVGDLPEALEKEPNDSPETATHVEWPGVVNGQAGKPGDVDYYELTAKKGQQIVFEVFAQRLGSPMDSALRLYNDKGQQLAENEDFNIPTGNDIFFAPRTTDSRIQWTCPADGTYRLLVRDLYSANRGGPEFVYRLEVRLSEPDFRVVMVPDHRSSRSPDNQQVPQGGRMEWMAYAERRGGFDGEIRLEAKGLPAGVTMEPVLFGPGVTTAQIVLYAAPTAPPGAFAPITMLAHAVRDGKPLAREVQIDAITGPTVNTPTPQRLGRSAVVSVTDPVMCTATTEVSASAVPQGGKLPVKVTVLRRADWKNAVELTPPTQGLPHNLQIANVTVAPEQQLATVVLEVPKNMPPGQYAVTLNVSGQVPQGKDGKGGNRRETYPSSPIVFTVTAAK